jgi:hypothetical protein
MKRDDIIIEGYLQGYMQKTAMGPAPMMQAPQAPEPAVAGMGMGPGLPAQGAGFPTDPAMVADQEQVEVDAAAEAEEQEREGKLAEMGQELDELKYDSKEQKFAGDILKEKMKIKKQQEDLKQTVIAQENDTSLSSMMGTNSPGE